MVLRSMALDNDQFTHSVVLLPSPKGATEPKLIELVAPVMAVFSSIALYCGYVMVVGEEV